MSNYSLTITSTSAARQLAASKGYNFVFAKGVSSGGDVDYNAAWIVLNPNEMAPTETISWDVEYYANFSTSQFKDKAEITGSGDPLNTVAGGQYVVSSTGDLIVDPNHSPQGSAFHFHNDAGYSLEYIPILESVDNNNNRVPIWAASTGVTINGLIAATPVEVVRVWAGKYEQGEAVLAEYATIGVEFDLTTKRSGTASINDTLSEWDNLSSNAHTFEPDTNIVLPVADDAINYYLNNVGEPITVTVLAFFKYAITTATLAYLTKSLINKFSGGLKPSQISLSKTGVKITFQKAGVVLATVGTDAYETAVNNALTQAQKDPASGLQGDTWSLSETELTVSYT